MKTFSLLYPVILFASILCAQGKEKEKESRRDLADALNYSLIKNPVDELYVLLAGGKYEEAKKEALELLKTNPENYHLNVILSQIAEREKNNDGIIKYSSTILKSRPKNGVALAMRAFAFKNKGDNVKALADLKKSLEDKGLSDEFKKNVSLNIGEIEKILNGQKGNDDNERKMKLAQEERARLELAQREAEYKRKEKEYKEKEARYLQEQARLDNEYRLKKEEYAKRQAQLERKEKAFKSYDEKKFADAEKSAKEALAHEPNDVSMNLLLATLFNARSSWNESRHYADKVIELEPENYYAISLRAYAYKSLNKYQEALRDFKKALLEKKISPESYKVIKAEIEFITSSVGDAEAGIPPQPIIDEKMKQAVNDIKNNETQKALGDLSVMANINDEKIKTRANFLIACLEWKAGKYEQAYKKFSEVFPKVETVFERSECLSRMAQYQQKKSNPDEAINFAKKSAELMPDSKVRNLQIAYLLVDAEKDTEAAGYFEKAFKAQDSFEVPDEAYLDGAYTNKRLGENEKAQEYLRFFIEAKDERKIREGGLSRDGAERLFRSRREYESLEREFGSYSLFQYQKTAQNYMMLGIEELYYRPYYENGKFIEVYGTYIQNIDSDLYVHGWETGYSILGVRGSPFMDYNFVVGLEEVFKIGEFGIANDTRLRLDYSWNEGFDINPVECHWQYSMIFSEFVQSLRRNERIFVAEGRYGRNFKSNCFADNLTVAPHLFYYADYNNQDFYTGGQWRSYAGPGLHIRKWYRETKYAAPQSYFDITLQYRMSFLKKDEHSLFITIFNAF